MTRSRQQARLVLLFGLLPLACAPAASTPPPQQPALARPVAPGQPCPKLERFPLDESYWFNVFEDFQQLTEAIRSHDDPQLAQAITGDPCTRKNAPCDEWGFVHTWEAEWHYKMVAAKLVTTRKTKGGGAQDKSLVPKAVGNFVVGVLSEQDYRCPGRPSDRCYENWNEDEPPPPEPVTLPPPRAPRYCESDLSIQCSPDGDDATLEILDVQKLVIYRIATLRHLQDWRPSPRSEGGLRIALDGCLLEL